MIRRPSPLLECFKGIRACTEVRLDTTELKNMSVAVQGLGNVGLHLVKLLKNEGARIVAADIDMEKDTVCQSHFRH